MNITRAAIEKNRITGILLLIVLTAGLGSYFNMPRSEDPGFIVRTALILTYFPGASPERVEQLVTEKLEKAIQEMPELDFVSSQSKTGVSVIFVNIQERYKHMRPIWDNLRRKIDRVRADLPEGVIGPDVNDEFGDVFGTILTVTGDGYSYAELKDIADAVRNELLRIDEVAKVEIHGAQQERVFLEYNNARLSELGLSPGQLKQILDTRNIIIPGGHISTGTERIVLEPSGNFESVEELARTVIKLPGRPDVVYLGDIVEVQRGYVDPPSAFVHSSGEPALALAISLREGGNIIDLGEKVKATVARLQSLYPVGIDFNFVAFQPIHVDRKVKEFVVNLLQAVAIVLLVMLISLGMRTGLVVASLIPMAMIMSLLLMSFFDIGINQMSLASLIIALGMLVDNAIVMSESILSRMSEGQNAVEASVESACELRIPLLISSLTTAAAFLPIFLAESTTGEYTAPLFKVVTITLMSSWVLSLTMTPLFCVWFLKVKKNPEETYDTRFYRGYMAFLTGILRRPLPTLLAVTIIFVVSMAGFGLVPAIFFPPNDKAIFTAELELPQGTPIERTAEIVGEVESYMRSELMAPGPEESGIGDWVTFIGQGAPRFFLSYNPEPARPEYALLLVNAVQRDGMDSLMTAIERFCLSRYPDIRTDIRPLPLGPPVKAPVEARISGPDIDRVFAIADSVKSELAAIAGTKNIRDDWGSRTKKLLVHVNQPRARRAGLTSRDVAISLQTVLTGLPTTEYREDDDVIPVVLRTVAADRHDIGKLESHNIYSQATGRSVPLKQVADIEVAWEASKIFRRDRQRTVTVSCDIEGEETPIAIGSLIQESLRRQKDGWGVGYQFLMGGEIESSGKANDAIMDKLPIAGMIILLLLVGQFNSFRKSLIILLVIPLGMIGVVVGLLLAQSYMGFMTFLGVISLAGIVINNAIVLLDRIRIEIDENGLSPQDAILESCKRRLRPILLTTATTVGGLLPLWFGGGAMYEPMAIAIIFGLLFATVLTLGVVPVLYSLFYRVRFRD